MRGGLRVIYRVLVWIVGGIGTLFVELREIGGGGWDGFGENKEFYLGFMFLRYLWGVLGEKLIGRLFFEYNVW